MSILYIRLFQKQIDKIVIYSSQIPSFLIQVQVMCVVPLQILLSLVKWYQHQNWHFPSCSFDIHIKTFLTSMKTTWILHKFSNDCCWSATFSIFSNIWHFVHAWQCCLYAQELKRFYDKEDILLNICPNIYILVASSIFVVYEIMTPLQVSDQF